MIAADSDGEASFVEVTESISQESQRQHHQHNDNFALDADSDSDVKLWLQHTGFFDIERRQRFLSALRKLKAIDEERSKILDELRVCTEYSTPSPTSTLPQSPGVSESFSPLFSTPPKTGRGGYNSLLSSQSTSFASFGERLGSETSSVNKAAGSDDWSMTFQNRSAFSQQHVQTAQPSVEAATSLDNNAGYEIQGADSPSSSNTPSSTESHSLNKDQAVRNYTSPQILSLAPKQESRYFLVKSFSTKNVDMSQRDGLWITSAHNGAMFANAFKHHKDVFLIFSINQSKAFQGYARMITRPQATIPRAKWMRNIPSNPSAPFRIQWLNTARTDFWRLGNLRNPLNYGKLVFIGKDGQEFPEACGREVIRVLDQGDEGDDGADTADWMTKKSCDHAADRGEMSTWQQRDESLEEEEEVASTSVEPEPVEDKPLIDY